MIVANQKRLFFFILAPWFLYLLTLSPTINHKDSPEFVDTAFTLGISHPAGFPTYNLFAKGFTFFPVGSIPFKVNLFSALFACLALVVLYAAGVKMLRLIFPHSKPSRFIWPAILPVGLLAFSQPFWFFSVVAEVYTLHAFFICLILLFLLLWKEKEDVRFLYLAALVYGLSAGNHATMAFLLPAILLLFLLWNKQRRLRNLGVSILFFLVGFSVYLYLPVRSITEPSIDWGNPQTLNGFLYQVTDRKDANLHFSALRNTASNDSAAGLIETGTTMMGSAGKGFHVFQVLIQDLNRYLSPVVVLGFLAGGYICFRRNVPLFVFFLLTAGLNAAFFAGWRRESYFPTYITACLFTTLFLYWIFYGGWWERFESFNKKRMKKKESDSGGFSELGIGVFDRRRWGILVCSGIILWTILINYHQADRSGLYSGETLLKRAFLTLENRSIFITGMSWFDINYNNDVLRLRDDVTVVTAWDLLSDDPPSMMTTRRYPDLHLPNPARHRFDSRETATQYLEDLLELNSYDRPILLEQNLIFFEEFPIAEKFEPYRNLFLKYGEPGREPVSGIEPDPAFVEFKEFITDEIRKPGIQRDRNWITKIAYFIPSFAMYFHDRKRYADEREVLKVMYEFLGQQDSDWYLKMVDNLILDGKVNEAQTLWKTFQNRFPKSYKKLLAEGLLSRAEGDSDKALSAFEEAVLINTDSFRGYLELGTTYKMMEDELNARRVLSMAKEKVSSLRELKMLRQTLALEIEKTKDIFPET